MLPDDIKPGRTYAGRDGKQREVYSINTARFANDRENVTVSFFIPSAKYAKTLSLVEFAAWAVREVPSPAACGNCGEIGWPCCGADGAVREVE